MQVRSLLLTCGLLSVLIVCACSSKLESKPDALIDVSWKKSPIANFENYSAQFRMRKASWEPSYFDMGDVHHLEQRYCLQGDAVSGKNPWQMVDMCFAVNEDKPYKMMQDDPLEIGTYPIGQPVPGRMYSVEKNKLVVFRFVLYEKNPRSNNILPMTLQYREAEGELKILSATMKSIAGEFHLNDSNISVEGAFDCPLGPSWVRP
jgi:hypothetical protein